MSSLYNSESISFNTDRLKKSSGFEDVLNPLLKKIVESGMMTPISDKNYYEIVINLINKYILPEIKSHKIQIEKIYTANISTYYIKSINSIPVTDLTSDQYNSLIFDPPEVLIPSKTIIKEALRCL